MKQHSKSLMFRCSRSSFRITHWSSTYDSSEVNFILSKIVYHLSEEETKQLLLGLNVSQLGKNRQ